MSSIYEQTLATGKVREKQAELSVEAKFALGASVLEDLARDSRRAVAVNAGMLAILDDSVRKLGLQKNVTGVCLPAYRNNSARTRGDLRAKRMAEVNSPPCLFEMSKGSYQYDDTDIGLAVRRPDFPIAIALLDSSIEGTNPVSDESDFFRTKIRPLRVGEAMILCAQRQINGEPMNLAEEGSTLWFPGAPSAMHIEGANEFWRRPIMKANKRGVPAVQLVDTVPKNAVALNVISVEPTYRDLGLAA